MVSDGTAAAQEVPDGPPEFRNLRYEEDWRPLCDSSRRTQALEDFNCIPIAPTVTLTLGGDLRERVEAVNNPVFGITRSSDQVFLHRAMLHGDLRVGDTVRGFVQIGTFWANRRNGPNPTTDIDRLDLVQGFVDLSVPVGQARATLRAGRQEVAFGSSRLVGVRDGPNVRRAFDGARGFINAEGTRVDAFYVRPVDLSRGAFDDRTSNSEAFWGVYGTGSVAGPLKADLYYLGLDRDIGRFAIGAARERRHTLGGRLFGRSGGWDWDWEAAYQFGSFGDRDIGAWTVASDTGFTFEGAPLQPRLGLKADIASGDRDPADGRLGTFNALYPKLPYFSEANLIAPANIIDVQPNITLALSRSVDMTIGYDAVWRATTRDAVYTPVLSPLQGTAGRGGRYVGGQAIVGVEWRASENLTLAGQYVHFEPGSGVRQAGGRTVDFLFASASLRF